jgi:phosphatidylserine/phosphatidylglycerophosphate/cardiolipin synthase-like enzyme
MTDARLATCVERTIIDAIRQRRTGDATALSKEFGRIIAGAGGVNSVTLIAESVLDGIRTALPRLDRVGIAVTGTAWIGGGIGSVEDLILKLLKEAEHEVLLTAYSITAGSFRVMDRIEAAVATGIRTRLIVDRFDEQEPKARQRLQYLIRQFPKLFTVRDFAGGSGGSHLHAKTLVVDRRKAVVGSANLTFHGMMTAHELAVVIEGPAAEAIAGRIDLLAESSGVRVISA